MLTTTTSFMGRRGMRRRCWMRRWRGMRSRGRMINLWPWLIVRMHLRLRMTYRRTRRTIHYRTRRMTCRRVARMIHRCMRRMVHRRIVGMIHRRRIMVPCGRRIIMRRVGRCTYMPCTRRRMIVVECHRPRYRGRSRTPMIHIGKSTPVLVRRLLMLRLHRGGRDVMLIHRLRLLRRGSRLYTIGPTIEARPAIVVNNHRSVDIGIVNDGSIYPGDCRIVTEMSSIPFPTAISYATITTPIINAAIEPYVRAPISGMPGIDTAAPTPIPRGPQKTNGRRCRPITRNPVITVIIVPGPVTRHPEITVHRTKRLLVNRYGRRCNMHRNSNADLRIHPTSRKTQG